MADTNSIVLPYGKETIAFTFRAAPEMLDIREPEPDIDCAIFRTRLLPHLRRADLDLTHPTVVVADKTRLCGYAQYLPVLLAALADAGANMERLRIYIAYGTHARQSEAQCRQAYGPAYAHANWVHHDCVDTGAFVELGRTRRGTPVRLRRDIVEASCVITFGAISHHYFAGFGGGRKLIFPGLGEKAAIHANHGLFLDPERRRTATGCQPGMLAGNPLAEDLAEYETFRPADVAVHGILNSHGHVCDLQVGQCADHFLSACARHGERCTVSGGPYDLVLASCGGFPKDINFIQSHKAIHNAAAFVRDGGLLIVLAHCTDGIGSDTFMPWFEMGDRDAAFDRLANHYVGNGGTALAMMDKLRRIRIGVVTQLEPSTAARIGFEWLSVARARQEVAAHKGGSIAVIPNAGMVVRARSADNE
jgi:lactate racemase